MEGPSLFLAREQLSSFQGKLVQHVTGNTKIGKERILEKEVVEIFAWGKHLVFQFDEFAYRFHFLLFGTFTATVDGKSVTGDYKKKSREPRLTMTFENGSIETYNCSIKVLEGKHVKQTYDFSIDIMSSQWNPTNALKQMKLYPEEQIADVLLDQTVFAGVGNIIKNEVLFLTHVHPEQRIKDLSIKKCKEIIEKTNMFSHQFYEWRKIFVLRQHLQIHRKSVCPLTQDKIERRKTGKRNRWSYICPNCQPLLI